MRKTVEMMQGTHKRKSIGRSGEMSEGYDADFTSLEQRAAKHYATENEERKCTECMQWGRVNHRGVCEFCEDPYGVSALMALVELEEAVLRGQE